MKRQPTCAENKAERARIAKEASENPNHIDHYFYSLVRPYQPQKQRKCLRCRDEFKSYGAHNRVCSVCQNIKVGAMATLKAQAYL